MRFSASFALADSDSESVAGSSDAEKFARQARERAFRARQRHVQTAATLDINGKHKHRSQLPASQKGMSRLSQRLGSIVGADEHADTLAFQKPVPVGLAPMARPSLAMDIHAQTGKLQAFETEVKIEAGPSKVPDAPKKERIRKKMDVSMDLESDSLETIGRSRQGSCFSGRRPTVPRRLRNGMEMEDWQIAGRARPPRNKASTSSASADRTPKEDTPEPSDEDIEELLYGPCEEYFVYKPTTIPHWSKNSNDHTSRVIAQSAEGVRRHRYHAYVTNMAQEGINISAEPRNKEDWDAADAWHERINKESYDRANRMRHANMVLSRFPKYNARRLAGIEQENEERHGEVMEARWFEMVEESGTFQLRAQDSRLEVEEMLRLSTESTVTERTFDAPSSWNASDTALSTQSTICHADSMAAHIHSTLSLPKSPMHLSVPQPASASFYCLNTPLPPIPDRGRSPRRL